MKRVLVLDANQRSALAVTRSLGNHCVPLITADETRESLAGSSRYSQLYVTYPSPQQHSEQFIAAIVKLCKEENIDIVFPITELTTNLLLIHQDKLPGITLPCPDIDNVNGLADKHKLMQLAESLDIPIPKTLYVESINKLSEELTSMDYPLVLKPGKSWLSYDGEWLHTSVKFADNAAESSYILKDDPAFRAHPFILQENVPGKGEGVFAIYDKGKPLAFFAHKRLREKPPQGGVSVLSESVSVNSTLMLYARKLLDHANWHGVAMVEFRVSPEGKPYLMEINTRFWGSLQLAVDAGVDFPWLLYQITCGSEVDIVSSYKIGKRLRWVLGDLDSLYLTLRDRNFSLRHKILSMINFITPRPFITRHEVNRLTDIKPFLWEIKQYVKELSN